MEKLHYIFGGRPLKLQGFVFETPLAINIKQVLILIGICC